MPLGKQKVFGIGFHKTGTKTLGQALTTLGYRVKGPFGAQDPDIAKVALRRALDIARSYDAFNDNPWAILFKELDANFPGSKFILTRRAEDRWLRSQIRYFGAKSTPMREWIYGVGAPLGNEDVYLRRYRQHNAAVLSYFSRRPDDLLIMDFERKDGWAQLCGFLRTKRPGMPFPHANPTL